MSGASKLFRFSIVFISVAVLALVFHSVISARGIENGEPEDQGQGRAVQETTREEEIGIQNQAGVIDEPGGNGEPVIPVEGSVNAAEEEETLAFPDDPGLAFFYKRWSAETFVPYDDGNTWNYNSGGCFYHTGGTSWWDISVQVPEGAEIDFLRVYYYDTDAGADAEAFLFRFDDIGGNVQVASAAGSGIPGYSSAGSDFFSEIVDNLNYSYVIRIDFNAATTSSLSICAVRIRYSYDLVNLSLPTILNMTEP